MHRSVGFGGAREEKVGIGKVDALGGVGEGDLAKNGLEADGESGGGFGVAFAEPFEAAAGLVVDVIGHVVPETFGAVLVEAADFGALLGGDVGDGGGAAAAELEDFGEIDILAVEGGFVGGTEVGIEKIDGGEAIFLVRLIPRVTIDDGAAQELLAAFGGDGSNGEGRGFFGLGGFLRIRRSGGRSGLGRGSLGMSGEAAELFELLIIF